MERLAFNINDFIFVQIKPEGFEHWKSYYDKIVGHELRPLSHYTKQADANGYVAMQAHEFMQVFGPTICLGMNPVFHPTILLQAQDVKPVDDEQ